MSFSNDLHEALAHYNLVPETDPLLVCSTDYRMRFREAISRSCVDDPEAMADEIKSLGQRCDRLVDENDSLQEDVERLEEEAHSLKRDIGRLEDELAETRQKLEDATKTKGAA